MKFLNLGALLLMSFYAQAQCPVNTPITSDCTTTGNFTISGKTLTVNSGVTVTITGNLILNNDATINASGAILNIGGSFVETYGGGSSLNTVNGGTFNLLNAGSNFSTGSGSNFNMTDATFQMNGGTITMNNGIQNYVGSTFTGASSMSVNLSSMTIDNTRISTTGNMELEKAIITNGSSLNAGGLLQIASGATTVDNSTIQTGTGFANATGQEALEFNGGGSLVLNNGSSMTVRGDLIDQRNLVIDNSDVTITGSMTNAGGDVLVVRNGGTLTVGGNFTNSGGSSIESNSGGVVSVEGDFSNGGNSSVDTDGGVVVVGGTYSGDPPTGDGSGCTGGSGACCGSSAACSTLPVSLVTFSGKNQGNSIVLNWLTASEENNNFFTISRSFDGIAYETIAIIKGNGTTADVSQYQYEDENPMGNSLYYRLSQTDFDGTSEILKIVFIDYNQYNPELRVYPTRPGKEKIVYIAFSDTIENSSLFLVSANGQKISGLKVIPVDNKLLIDLSDKSLVRGIYLLTGKINEQLINTKLLLD
ncbi:MAG: hypothetical protein WBA74_03535 [Cyclobacteriaceae bacterium]